MTVMELASEVLDFWVALGMSAQAEDRKAETEKIAYEHPRVKFYICSLNIYYCIYISLVTATMFIFL